MYPGIQIKLSLSKIIYTIGCGSWELVAPPVRCVHTQTYIQFHHRTYHVPKHLAQSRESGHSCSRYYTCSHNLHSYFLQQIVALYHSWLIFEKPPSLDDATTAATTGAVTPFANADKAGARNPVPSAAPDSLRISAARLQPPAQERCNHPRQHQRLLSMFPP